MGQKHMGEGQKHIGEGKKHMGEGQKHLVERHHEEVWDRRALDDVDELNRATERYEHMERDAGRGVESQGGAACRGRGASTWPSMPRMLPLETAAITARSRATSRTTPQISA